jgi:hypothetical protein
MFITTSLLRRMVRGLGSHILTNERACEYNMRYSKKENHSVENT